MEDCAVLLNTCKPGLFVMNKILVMQVKQLFVLHSFMESNHYVLHYIPGEHRSHLLHGGSLKSCLKSNVTY